MREFSEVFKRKMVAKMTGPNAISAIQLARDQGMNQQTLSRWLGQARSLPHMPTDKQKRTRRDPRPRSVVEKISILAGAAKATGDELLAFLEREGVSVAELEQWRLALEGRHLADSHHEAGPGSRA